MQQALAALLAMTVRRMTMITVVMRIRWCDDDDEDDVDNAVIDEDAYNENRRRQRC